MHHPWDWTYLTDYLHMLVNSITILVVAIPEGLPLAVTLALAFSVKKLLQEKNLVRKLSACEVSASVTSVLSDKTGTLTENRMVVKRLLSLEDAWAGDRMKSTDLTEEDSHFKKILTEGKHLYCPELLTGNFCCAYTSLCFFAGFVLCSSASRVPDPDNPGCYLYEGNRTETALLDYAEELGASYNKIRLDNM